MDYFDFVLAEVHGVRPAELVDFKKGGKVFSAFCAYVPDEVIFAAGGIATGLCLSSRFWVRAVRNIWKHLPADQRRCWVHGSTEHVRSIVWQMYISVRPLATAKKAYEILGTDVPIHVMDLPQMKR